MIVRNLTFSETVGGLRYVIMCHFRKAKVYSDAWWNWNAKAGHTVTDATKLITCLLQIYYTFTSLTFSHSPSLVPLCKC